ncbi:hypothetical protein NGA_0697800 [Nannochloropsis gaditana CCMP526]|nr:hypothetical protein NGA_0697800 [Nannochloropsis gaditana CCMP526]EKU23383.1 hypothetical protein NGA_0697800 [Nannochloropsis gaditana CCMP526]|eukprot:XP_005852449.1 hypothetical protein NGA_0697800 [Nannochloropsis gaditana CCMP526]
MDMAATLSQPPTADLLLP